MFKILNELVEIPINDRLISADRRTRGGHNQAYKHLDLFIIILFMKVFCLACDMKLNRLCPFFYGAL